MMFYCLILKLTIKLALDLSLASLSLHSIPEPITFAFMNKVLSNNPPGFFQNDICCPVCNGTLKEKDDLISCNNIACQKTFPVVNGVPVLINESNSIFSAMDFVSGNETTMDLKKRSRIKSFFTSFLPSITANIKARENYEYLHTELKKKSEPKVLIIGCGILGHGLKELVEDSSINVVESDVALGPRTSLICDSHNIPFKENTFDAIIAQAVLEHVLDPYQCVAEMHRVLKPDGIVYAETPFMQQVHMREYDFTRFTFLGHRRLFRHFTELKSGPVVGPGSALAWSYQYFLLSFVKRRLTRKIVITFTSFTSFFLKYFDYYLIKKQGSFDAASGFFFIGKKSTEVLPDKELLKLYKGGM
jgi:SAM-dependent methyltransferase